MTNIAMENPQNKWRFYIVGKSSISMGHLYHGYVKLPEGIYIYIYIYRMIYIYIYIFIYIYIYQIFIFCILYIYIYPLVMTNIAMENPQNKWRFYIVGKSSINGPSVPWLC